MIPPASGGGWRFAFVAAPVRRARYTLAIVVTAGPQSWQQSVSIRYL